MTLKIIVTADGSHSLFNEELNETYHSIHGAIQESRHVFIENGLRDAVQRNKASNISILEVGLGTGLNALLTIQYLRQHSLHVHYTAIESSPLSEQILSQLNHAAVLGLEHEFQQVHESEWGMPDLINHNFTFTKLHCRLQDIELTEPAFDLIYYDAFAPSKQAELWALPVLEKIAKALKADGVFVTYCATGQLKRNLKTVGLTVETLPGPPGKKEMVRARKPHAPVW